MPEEATVSLTMEERVLVRRDGLGQVRVLEDGVVRWDTVNGKGMNGTERRRTESTRPKGGPWRAETRVAGPGSDWIGVIILDWCYLKLVT